MIKYYTCSDIGSVLIGNKDWTFAVPNMGGDGRTKVLIFEEREEFAEYEKNHDVRFISSVQGTFNIYANDCDFDAPDDEIITTLEGRFGVYRGDFSVIFERWECKKENKKMKKFGVDKGAIIDALVNYVANIKTDEFLQIEDACGTMGLGDALSSILHDFESEWNDCEVSEEGATAEQDAALDAMLDRYSERMLRELFGN